MNLHEYQAKRLFKEYGIPVPKGMVAQSVDEAIAASMQLETPSWVVKAQIHAGGRGKAGGVKIVDSKAALSQAAKTLLHQYLVTPQTTAQGVIVNELLIEETCEIVQEFYVSLLVDRSSQKIVILGCAEGGVDIEELATKTPEKIVRMEVDPFVGVMAYQCREMAFALGLDHQGAKQFVKIGMHLGKLFWEKDLALVEINPMVLTEHGILICLDAKISVDDNALYRQALLKDLRDPTQEDKRELWAREWNLSYIALEGRIGCMVNGAGLAMATMDLIKLQGGDPANFLDVGGQATPERVAEAFKIIVDADVKVIFINIFGGIVRCDLIAQGIIDAVSQESIAIPVVVRLAGNQAEEAQSMLEESGLNIISESDFTLAAKQAVKLAKGSA